MPSVLVRANKVVRPINPVRPLTTAESANGGTRYPVNAGIEIHIGGTVTIADGQVTAITNPNALDAAMSFELAGKQRLIELERIPVANWGLADVPQTDSGQNRLMNLYPKAQGYWWWLEMIGRALKSRTNRGSSARRASIQAELDQNPYDWYNDHATQFTFRNTNAFYVTPNNAGANFSSITMDMSADWTGGLVKYLVG